MAINPGKVKFLFEQLPNAEYSIFKGITQQLFNYLSDEVKDNPVYDKYEKDLTKWESWPNYTDAHASSRNRWELPTNLEDTKSLSYSLYKRLALKDTNAAISFTHSLFREKTLGENARKLNGVFLGYFGQALEDILKANPEIEKNTPNPNKNKVVFIIHGHDNELKTEVQLLLFRAGVANVVLHEQADMGRTIIDKLIGETQVAGYAIALLTPDDITDKGTNRARQNVILEIGYFLGKLGKERLRMIVRGDVEIPSDMSGVLYEKHDATGAWKIKLLKELQAVGIYVDIQAALSGF